ncbi:hypothetical protein ACFPM3_21720 [Streptomyces coeruleoprunus]|uniref:LigA protein n=1 Tax=Streptomyces coeruleoprunus TaxID=285563 RepID=A0ABV9XIA4_9ACTN
MSKDRSPFWRRRGVRLTAVASAAVVVVAGGTFWMSGGYAAWRNDRALDSACDGDLAADRVRELLPGVELTSSSELQHDGWYCSASAADEQRDGGAGVEVRIRNADEPFGDVDGWIEPGDWATPLGNGWTGSFQYAAEGGGERPGEARVTLLLDCGEQSGDGLLAVADGRLKKGEDFRDAAVRARLTTVLTETATAYAKRTGCEVKAGQAVKDLPAATTVRDHKPLDKASGTCAGVVDPATARRWGAGTVIETRAEPAPVERCTLGSRLGAPLYDFTASYGPYGERAQSSAPADVRAAKGAATSPTGRYRMTAECPGGGGTAVYDIAPDEGLVLDHKTLRTALAHFATKSATSHNCKPPA